MIEYARLFYKYWAGRPIWVPMLYFLITAPTFWFGVFKPFIINYPLIVPTPDAVRNVQGYFVPGHHAWRQPYTIYLRDGKHISLYCNPVNYTSNTCLADAGIEYSSIENSLMKVGYIVEPSLSGLGTINIIMDLSEGENNILSYDYSSAQLVKEVNILNSTRVDALSISLMMMPVLIWASLFIGLMCRLHTNLTRRGEVQCR